MKQIKFFFTAVITAFWIVCASSSAFAYSSSYGWAESYMYYDTFKYSITSSKDNITEYSYNNFCYAAYNEQSAVGTEEALVENDGVGGDNWAWSELDTTVGEENIYAAVSVDNPETASTADASTEYSVMFSSSEAGTLNLSIDYELYIGALSASTSSFDEAYAESLAYISINGEVLDFASIFFDAYNGLYDEELSELGTLDLTYEYAAGENVAVLFGVEAYADAVPVPGTGLLLSAGLIVLAAIRRKN